jgi:hypothetical protein
MKVLINPRELIKRGKWMQFCDMMGLNPHVIAEGQMNDTVIFELTEEQAEQLCLVIIVKQAEWERK